MKVLGRSRLLKAVASPKGELVGSVSSSLLTDTFLPSRLCPVWSFVQITSEVGDQVVCEGCRMEEGVGPFLFSELLDCLSCLETGLKNGR